MGDFNQTLSPQESSAGGSRITAGMNDFRLCNQATGLSDIPFQGPSFTWWNNQVNDPLAKKLDRALINVEWRQSFPQSYSSYGPMEFSDHTPVLMYFGNPTNRKKSFKFANHLLYHSKFLDVIAQFWDSTHFAGNSLFILARKLKQLKPELKSFNSTHYSDLEARVNEARLSLQRIQEAFILNPCKVNAKEQKKRQSIWWSLVFAEEKFVRQRARVKWFQHGDRNTSFFHKVVQGRRATNHIHYLLDNGTRLEGRNDMADHCISFFSNLLGAEPPPVQLGAQTSIKSFTKFRCDPSLKPLLEAEVSEEEIKKEVFNLPKNKCPGPDGFNGEFFMHCWPVLGNDLVRAIKEFFDNGEMLRQLNATTISLIPKRPGAQELKDFRPISLCNVIYKVISKIITRRLQLALPGIISSNQSAFVKGRSLVENVSLATELVKGFGTKIAKNRGALKVDLTKAFDTVRWDFILSILQAAEFPSRFIIWIRECLTTTSFSVCLNGELCGYFPGKRGLRQGDPLSPSLFLLAMEVFGEILKASFDNGSISYHTLCRKPKITHLSFADDVIIFFDGKPESLKGITSVFREFKSLSGLTLNKSKTTLFTTGLSLSEDIEVREQGYTIGELPVRYLGLPLLTRRMRRSDYSPLIDSILKRFTSWTVRKLSFAGRLQLISSVTYSIVNFWMGAFSLPRGCLREITKMCTKFLWSGSMTQTPMYKVSWRTLCLTKEEGGLGFRDLASWNAVLNLKLVWLLFMKEGSLWVAWIKAHWLKHNSYWTAPRSSSTSTTWRSLLSLRPLVKKMLTCVLGNGRTASFWHDSWHKAGPLIHITGEEGPMKLGLNTNSTVSDACTGNQWRLPQERTRCPLAAEVRAALLPHRTPNPQDGNDSYLWGESSSRSRTFSTRKTWDALRRREDCTTWSSSVWFKGAIPKHSFLFWIVTLDRLPLRTRLHKWGITDVVSCVICGSNLEDREHLFLHCDFALQIWKWLETKLHTSCSFPTWGGMLTWLRSTSSREQQILRGFSTQAAIYCIWKERNNRYHNASSSSGEMTIATIDKTVRLSLLASLRRKRHQRLLSLWFRFA